MTDSAVPALFRAVRRGPARRSRLCRGDRRAGGPCDSVGGARAGGAFENLVAPCAPAVDCGGRRSGAVWAAARRRRAAARVSRGSPRSRPRAARRPTRCCAWRRSRWRSREDAERLREKLRLSNAECDRLDARRARARRRCTASAAPPSLGDLRILAVRARPRRPRATRWRSPTPKAAPRRTMRAGGRPIVSSPIRPIRACPSPAPISSRAAVRRPRRRGGAEKRCKRNGSAPAFRASRKRWRDCWGRRWGRWMDVERSAEVEAGRGGYGLRGYASGAVIRNTRHSRSR